MNKLERIIEEKKTKSSERRPRYGTRKLAVGMVSCVLGYMVFVSSPVLKAEKVEVLSGDEVAIESFEDKAITRVTDELNFLAESSSKKENILAEVSDNAVVEDTVQAESEETQKGTDVETVKEESLTAEESENNALAPVEEAAQEVLAENVQDEAAEAEETDEAQTRVEPEESAEEASEPENAEDTIPMTEEKFEEAKTPVTEEKIEEPVEAKEAEEVSEDEKEDAEENKEETADKDEKVEFALTEAQKDNLLRRYSVQDINEMTKEIKGKIAENADFDVEAYIKEKMMPRDISNEIQYTYVALTEEGHKSPRTVKPDDGEAIGWEISFTSPKGAIEGDYFKIEFSKNLSLKGIEPDHKDERSIKIDNTVVAEGERLDRSTIKYTFNDTIANKRNLRVAVKGFVYIDKTKVPNTNDSEEISISLGEKIDKHTINVEYNDAYYDNINGQSDLNGKSQFTAFDPDTGEFTQVFYINPDTKEIKASSNGTFFGEVGVVIDGVYPDMRNSDVAYTKENTEVMVQKVPAGTKLPGAVIEEPFETEDGNKETVRFRSANIKPEVDILNGKIQISFTKDNASMNDAYVVIVKSKAKPNQTGANVYSKATVYGFGNRRLILNNSIVYEEGTTAAKGNSVGYFKEHHIYYTYVDGKLQEDKTFNIDNTKMEGTEADKYFTSKNDIDGFKFVEVDADKLVENPKYNENGDLTRGEYEVGKTKEVTYIYKRDITSGLFQEHHIYQTVDKDGKVISEDATVNGDETKGIDEDLYTTSKIDKDGYKLVKVEATNDNSEKLGVQFDTDGSKTFGNYVNGKKLEVTYIYQRVATPLIPIEPAKETTPLIPLTPAEEIEEPSTPLTPLIPAEEIKEPTPMVPLTPAEEIEEPTPMVPLTPAEEVEEPTPLVPLTPAEEIEEPTPFIPLTPAEEIEEPTPYEPTVPERPETSETPEEVSEIPDVVPPTPLSPGENNDETEEVEEKTEEIEEVKENEEVQEETEETVTTIEQDTPNSNDTRKAPQTSVAGAGGFMGLAGLAAAMLAFLEDKKKKNK